MTTTRVGRLWMAVMTDERKLLERARAGDADAFDHLVRAYFPRVYAIAFRLAGNHEDAEDLAQETFVKAHGGLAKYRGDAAFSTWLARIVVHLARDRFRAAGRRPRTVPIPTGVQTGELEARAGADPGLELDRRELRRLLADAIERLPERLRTPFVLRVLEGADYADVAAAGGITVDTARAQVMRARRALARFLAPFLRDSGGNLGGKP